MVFWFFDIEINLHSIYPLIYIIIIFVFMYILVNIVKELEESLSMIEEITGYLKVVRSFPLVSLTFLRKLHIIRGEILESSKYILFDKNN